MLYRLGAIKSLAKCIFQGFDASKGLLIGAFSTSLINKHPIYEQIPAIVRVVT